jgi:NADPH-dependent ferric siderophore reductase
MERIAHFYSEKVHAEFERKQLQQKRALKKQLVTVTLSVDELDKFKPKKDHPDIRVQTTFYNDEAIDQAIFGN